MSQYDEFARRHLNVTLRTGNELMCRCLFHEESNASMQFNAESGLFICFSCSARGNIKTLERHLGIRIAEEGIDIADLRARIDALRHPTADVVPILPESYLKRFSFPTAYWGVCPATCATRGTDCKTHRGFSPATIASFDLGFSPIPDGIGSYATIPIRNQNGELLGIVKRYLDADVELKYRYPKGFKRSLNVFGSWLVEQDDEAHTVVLVEGSVDAMKVWEAGFPALALYGNSISPTQVRLLRRLGISKVVLLFDPDKGGQQCESACLGWHEHRRGRIKRKTYDPLTDLRRDFLVEIVSNSRKSGDPGSMTTHEIRGHLRRPRKVF